MQNTLVQLGLSSDGTSSGGLTKQYSGLTFEQTALQSSGSNFQQINWQKVQFNADLLNQGHEYLYRNWWHYKNQIKWSVY